MMIDRTFGAAVAQMLILNMAALPDKATARAAWESKFNMRIPGAVDPKASKVKVKAAANGAPAEIMIFDEIGYWGITAQDFQTQLATVDASEINVLINSPGGDVFDGIAIYNALKAHPAKINTNVVGLAASAASVIMLGGDTVTMSEGALVMCHRAWSIALGNASNMAETAAILTKIDEQLAAIYAGKTGKSASDCLAMMAGTDKNDGTWFTSQEAKDYGLADLIAEPPEEKPAAKNRITDRVPEPEVPNEQQALQASLNALAAQRNRLALAERD